MPPRWLFSQEKNKSLVNWMAVIKLMCIQQNDWSDAFQMFSIDRFDILDGATQKNREIWTNTDSHASAQLKGKTRCENDNSIHKWHAEKVAAKAPIQRAHALTSHTPVEWYRSLFRHGTFFSIAHAITSGNDRKKSAIWMFRPQNRFQIVVRIGLAEIGSWGIQVFRYNPNYSMNAVSKYY